MQSKWFCLMKNNVDFKSFMVWLKTDVQLSISTQLCSITTISNTGVSNHYASTAHEPSWLQSIFKFIFLKVIFGGPIQRGYLG